MHPALPLLALFLLLPACGPGDAPSPTDAPTASSTPTPSPSADATPSPTATPTADPTLGPSPSPSDAPTPSETLPSSPTPTLSADARFCAGTPFVTYENFGQGFMLENCQPCHASTAPNRYGAPEAVYFDTQEDVRTWQPRILARATGDAPSMPPGGGVSAEDRYLLEVWLRCYEP